MIWYYVEKQTYIYIYIYKTMYKREDNEKGRSNFISKRRKTEVECVWNWKNNTIP